MKISKEQFCKYIDKVKKRRDYENALNAVLNEYSVDGYVPIGTECDSELIDLLDWMFTPDDSPQIDLVEYFCWELNFGENWHPGCFTDNGVDIDFSSAEKVYDYLVDLK